MEVRDNKNVCIITPLSPILDSRESSRLLSEITNDNRKFALDLEYVKDCTIDFIDFLKELATNKNIGVFNIQSDVFVLFNIMGLDKSVNLFVNEIDFLQNERQLINRQFSVL